MNPQITVVIATYNSELFLAHIVKKIHSFLVKNSYISEIIIVNDASTDMTQKVASQLSYKFKNIRVLELTKNSGQQIALSAGIDHCAGKYIVLVDDDNLDIDFALSSVITPVVNKKCDIAIATTQPKGFFRKYSSSFFWWVIKRLSNGVINSRELTIRCFTKKVAEQYRLYGENHRSVTEIMFNLGFNRIYIPVQIDNRNMNKSRYNIHSRIKLFIQIITTFRNNSGIGLIYFSVITVLFFPITCFILYYTNVISFADRPSIILAGMIWLSWTITIFLFGLVIFTLSIIVRETQNRPLYHLKR